MSRATQYAFPHEDGQYEGAVDAGAHGLTILEHASIEAMKGAWLSLTDLGQERHIPHAAGLCVKMAQALIAELEKVQTP